MSGPFPLVARNGEPVAQNDNPREQDRRERLARLAGYLAQDPHNPALLRDAAQAALAAGEPQRAAEWLAVLETMGRADVADRNLLGIAWMRGGQPDRAAQRFADLLSATPGDPALRFNLAWARALAKDFAGARDLLDGDLTAALPQAALLEVQLMHDAGEFDAAADKARGHVARHPDYAPLLAAVSVLALDVEDEELARHCATRAGAHPDALTTLGTLTLGDMDHAAARALFERALAVNDHAPRAWIGLGLSHLAAGDGAQAGTLLDKGAELFGDHLGSWIAAGWAYLLAGDRVRAGERFEQARQIDPNFAESHGSLAVLDMLAGDRESAERRVEIAQRLDRESFSAAFARMLLATAAGDAETAERILALALKQPLDDKGRTIADALARMGR